MKVLRKEDKSKKKTVGGNEKKPFRLEKNIIVKKKKTEVIPLQGTGASCDPGLFSVRCMGFYQPKGGGVWGGSEEKTKIMHPASNQLLVKQ